MDFLPDIEKFKNFFDGTDSKNEISIAVEEAKKYDIFNLISRVSALNLFHQNQTKSVILDTYIEGVLCQTRDQFPSKYTISSGKFRKIINQISDTSLKYSIDPPENMFVQNIMFYGNYRVLNGIDQTPAYNLQHMISVLFAKGIEYPKEFLDATYILVNGMLEISEKIVGGILNTENNHDTDEEKGIMIALKFLIEYIAAVPPKGNIDIGENQYERLMAICSLIIDWSYKNDLFYYQIFNTPIEILKSHRIGMKQQEFQHMFSVNEAIRKEQLIASSVLDNSGDLIEYKSFGEEINAAFEKEYGYSFYQLKLFTEGLREYSKRQSGDTVYVARIMDIIEFMSAYNASFNEEVVGLIIDSIALRQREDFLVPPEPFRKEDVYPWRFNRELSFTRRPIIIRGDEMIWGNRQLDHMIRFTLGLINNGKLKAHSSKMNSLVGRISDERGAEFNDFIYKILVNFNVFEVYPNISKVNGVYIAENNNTLGDIDVLIIDREYHKIIAAEVKNFNFSKNPYEMHLEYKKMFENTKKKKGYYTKHCRRVDWCNKHIDDFKKQYGLDDGDWRVIGVFILSQSLVSTEIYHKEIKMLTEKELSVSSIRNIY